MSQTGSFNPLPGASQTISATNATSSITFTGAAVQAPQVLLTNIGPNSVRWRAGTGAQTAVYATDTPLINGASRIFNIGDATTIAAITTAAETATLVCTPGYGGGD